MPGPPVAGALLAALGEVEVVVVGGGGDGGKVERKGGLGSKWRWRRPMWLAKERVREQEENSERHAAVLIVRIILTFSHFLFQSVEKESTAVYC